MPGEKYQLNTRSHAKIWLTNDPAVFMPESNKIRLAQMRDLNHKATVTLFYDSELLNDTAKAELAEYCKEQRIKTFDINSEAFCSMLSHDSEKELYKHYKAEIRSIGSGGNLAAASDILRFLTPLHHMIYSDLDSPMNTSMLPDNVEVDKPFLINGGSFIGFSGQEFVMPFNDVIAVIDPVAADETLEKVRQGMLSKFRQYSCDLQDVIDAHMNDSFVNPYIWNMVKNRGEIIYAFESKKLASREKLGSLALREFIIKTTQEKEAYIAFKAQNNENSEQTIKRLRQEVQNQLGWMMYCFFHSDYQKLQAMLQKDDNAFLAELMKQERDAYLRIIVLYTTGPLEISRSLFGSMLDSQTFQKDGAFHIYPKYKELQKTLRMTDYMPLHADLKGLLGYTLAAEGSVNDSSWVSIGAERLALRSEALKRNQEALRQSLPAELFELRSQINEHVRNLGQYSFFYQERRREKRTALNTALLCFKEDKGRLILDTEALHNVLIQIYLNRDKGVFAGLFSHRTQTLIQNLERLRAEAVLNTLTHNRKLDVGAFNALPESKQPFATGWFL